MKPLVVMLLIVGSWQVCAAQKPVTWSYTSHKIGPRKYEVRMVASVVTPDWHIYSQSTPAGGPHPTIINFTKNPLVQFNGVPTEVGKLHKVHDDVLGVNVNYYQNRVEFVEDVELRADVQVQIAGTISYMVCTDEQCVNPAPESFNLSIGGESK